MSNYFILFAALAVTLLHFPTSESTQKFAVKDGFEYVGTTEGKIFLSPILEAPEISISWQSALDRCVSAGYRLANIESQAQNDVIAAFVTREGVTAKSWSWIDGTNFLDKDTFFSVHTGKNITYFNWPYSGRPVGDDKIRCLRWSHNAMEQGIWDVSCTEDKNAVICETTTS